MTDSESWTPIPGGTDWDKTSLDLLMQQVNPIVGKSRRPSLMLASIGTVSLSALSFYFAAQKFDDYMNGVTDLEQIESANHLYFLSGIGLGWLPGIVGRRSDEMVMVQLLFGLTGCGIYIDDNDKSERSQTHR